MDGEEREGKDRGGLGGGKEGGMYIIKGALVAVP